MTRTKIGLGSDFASRYEALPRNGLFCPGAGSPVTSVKSIFVINRQLMFFLKVIRIFGGDGFSEIFLIQLA